MRVCELIAVLQTVNPDAEVLMSEGAITGRARHIGSLAYAVHQGDPRPPCDTAYRILLEPSAVQPSLGPTDEDPDAEPIFGTHHLMDEV